MLLQPSQSVLDLGAGHALQVPGLEPQPVLEQRPIDRNLLNERQASPASPSTTLDFPSSSTSTMSTSAIVTVTA
jgi:hypothetical protein